MLRIKEDHLLVLIEKTRREMIVSGLEDGLLSKRTIELSQQLDEYIAKYQMLKLEKDIHSIPKESFL